MKFRVELMEKQARGYLCENYGAPFRLPELGPIGSQGLAQGGAHGLDHGRPFLGGSAFDDLDPSKRHRLSTYRSRGPA